MRAVVQRVSSAKVEVEGKVAGEIGPGLVVYLGVGLGDDEEDSRWMAEKIANLRVFMDGDGKMNLSVMEKAGAILAISQFTLFADARKGRRPSYSDAAPPEAALRLYSNCVQLLRNHVTTVETGVFQAVMRVSSVNEGPVTILLDSKRLF